MNFSRERTFFYFLHRLETKERIRIETQARSLLFFGLAVFFKSYMTSSYLRVQKRAKVQYDILKASLYNMLSNFIFYSIFFTFHLL